MSRVSATSARMPSRTALLLALGAAATCLVAPYPAQALVPVAYVSNCADSGSGSLRQALLDVQDGGTIDAHTQLAGVCSKIVVESAQLAFAGDDLTIVGPGADALTITALGVTGSILHHYQNRIFSHTGRGTLLLENLSVQAGFVTTTSDVSLAGGCIQSSANVKLVNASVSGCTVQTPAQAVGGAIAASGNVYLSHSEVLDSIARGTHYGASGGGISAASVTLRQATVAGNYAYGSTGDSSVVIGGGIDTGSIDIASSTISGNTAAGGRPTHYNVQSSVGGGFEAGSLVTISNSTVSGNSAGYYAGAHIGATTATIENSTFAFNRSSRSAGVFLSATTSLTIDSDIFSNNTNAFTGSASDLAIGGSVAASGTHNLVFATASPLPAGTLRNACPLLAPLAHNGGPTQTHALYSHSPAINAGNNAQNQPYDQRGAGFPRASGATDIGSYEVELGDEVFGSGFDGC